MVARVCEGWAADSSAVLPTMTGRRALQVWAALPPVARRFPLPDSRLFLAKLWRGWRSVGFLGDRPAPGGGLSARWPLSGARAPTVNAARCLAAGGDASRLGSVVVTQALEHTQPRREQARVRPAGLPRLHRQCHTAACSSLLAVVPPPTTSPPAFTATAKLDVPSSVPRSTIPPVLVQEKA